MSGESIACKYETSESQRFSNASRPFYPRPVPQLASFGPGTTGLWMANAAHAGLFIRNN